MLLVADVGNTNTVLGLFDGRRLVTSWRLGSSRQNTADEWGILVWNLFSIERRDPAEVTAVVVCSVVPPLTAVVERSLKKLFGVPPLVVGPGTRTGMPILADNPREVGTDRIVNAVAGLERVRDFPGHGLIVVDFGTATTFDCVSPKGEYLGGAIAPGVQISAEALYQRTAKLPRIDIAFPQSMVGKNTVHAMQVGIAYGYTALTDGLVAGLKRELPFPVRVVATGGFSTVLAPYARSLDEVDENLTLHGLRLIHERSLSQ